MGYLEGEELNQKVYKGIIPYYNIMETKEFMELSKEKKLDFLEERKKGLQKLRDKIYKEMRKI